MPDEIVAPSNTELMPETAPPGEEAPKEPPSRRDTLEKAFQQAAQKQTAPAPPSTTAGSPPRQPTGQFAPRTPTPSAPATPAPALPALPKSLKKELETHWKQIHP